MAHPSFSLGSRVKVPCTRVRYHPPEANIDMYQQLSNGISMPQIHLGVYLASGKEALESVRVALEVLYHVHDSD